MGIFFCFCFVMPRVYLCAAGAFTADAQNQCQHTVNKKTKQKTKHRHMFGMFAFQSALYLEII